MSKKIHIAEQFVRILWKPAPGDYVVFQNIRTQIQSVDLTDIYLAGVEGKFHSQQLSYRPKPADYEKILDELDRLNLFQYKERKYIGSCHWVVGIGIHNKQVIYLSGRSKKILARILELRVAHHHVNEAINQLVFSRYGKLPIGGVSFES
jgi:hypothetical protein